MFAATKVRAAIDRTVAFATLESIPLPQPSPGAVAPPTAHPHARVLRSRRRHRQGMVSGRSHHCVSPTTGKPRRQPAQLHSPR